ncbi:MAG: class I SAM-dependent DNA methyltransferase [Halanaerobiaceae bacterium]
MEKRDKTYTGAFARIYDDIMKNVPYDLWYKYLRELLGYFNKSPERIIDLACGTGNMTLRFARDFPLIIGVDRSSSMLHRAVEKAGDRENIQFLEADLVNMDLDSRFDFAFSVFDSLNYILSLEKLERVFVNVHQLLKPDGLFIFDMNTSKRLMSIEPGTTMFSGDNYSCLWEDIIDEKNVRWKVKLKIYLDDSDVDIFEEFHQETAYPVVDIKNSLFSAGFKYVDVFKAYTFDRGGENDNRLYYVATKQKGIGMTPSFLKKYGKKIKWKLLSRSY